MGKMKLRTKLIAGSVVMLLVPVAVSIAVVYAVMTQQNRTASYDRLKRSIDIIRDDLSARQEKLLSETVQLATVNGMGGTAKFIFSSKGNDGMVSVAENSSREAAKDVLQVARAGSFWQAAIYDPTGDMLFFAVRGSDDTFNVGYVLIGSTTTVKSASVSAGQELTDNTWNKVSDLPGSYFTLQSSGEMPEENRVFFETIDNHICLVSYAPIFSEDYNKETGKLEKRPYGFAVAVSRIGEAFVARTSSLTGMKVNLFAQGDLSTGNLPAYNKLSSDAAEEQPGSRNIVLNDVSVQDEDYFQGVLPLGGRAGPVGSVAVLYSKAIAKANTWQMVRLLGLIYLGCLLVIIPFSIGFSNSVSKPINTAIGSLNASAHEVSSASMNVSSSAHRLSEAATQQAASVEETSSSLEEMASMTRQNTANCEQGDGLSKLASKNMNDANQSMKALISSMEETSEASGNVAKIVKSIDEIAFQTNLLALNAAVEAARAGEAGAGFAVVADEVRNLALRSAEASKNTQELVRNIIEKIDEGSQLVKETDEKYRDVALNVHKVMELISEIFAASKEQTVGIDQVNKAVAEIDKMTQQNAADAEESASAAMQLNAQSEQMERIVDQLMALVGSMSAQEGAVESEDFGRKKSSAGMRNWLKTVTFRMGREKN